MELKNINVLEYSKSKDAIDYENLLKNLKPKNNFNNKEIDILQLPYSTIKYIQKVFNNLKDFNDICKIFSKVFECTENEFYNENVVNYYASRRYIFETFELISKNENFLTANSKIDVQKWKASGGDNLEQFSEIISLHSICERYGMYPFDISNKPYAEVFYLQCALKTYDEVNFNYNKND